MTIVWFQPNIVSNSSLPFKTTITAATIHARAAVVRDDGQESLVRSTGLSLGLIWRDLESTDLAAVDREVVPELNDPPWEIPLKSHAGDVVVTACGLKAEHLAGTRTHADRLWTLMLTEVWIREYLDQRSTWTLG